MSDQKAEMADSSVSTPRVAVAREELEIGKRTVETARVRVRKLVQAHEECIDELLMHDEVEVQRIPVGRVIDEPVQMRSDGDLLVVPVMEERLVVQKCLVLVEELHIKRRVGQRPHTEHVLVRTEEVVIEREPRARADDER
jgi:uncharacterized protein (TIGR02271 family)